MSCGSALAGPIGDRLGRRRTLIATVLLFGLATLSISWAHSLTVLGILRFFAGAGVGGAIPNATAIASEFAPLSRKAIAVSMTMICVPIGGMIGGIAAAQVLPTLGWRALFVIGGIAPLALCLVLFFFLPESPGFLTERKPAQQIALAEVFESGRTRDTLSLWLTTSCCLLCVYMSFSWLPTLLTAEGLNLAEASSGLAFYNLGGVAGALLCGALIARFGSRVPMLAAAFGAVASVLVLNLTATRSHAALLAGFAVHGLFVNAVQVTSFALATHIYPTGVRASGVAFALAIGRIGPIVSAFMGAGLITAGRSAFLNFLALAMTGTFVGLALIRNHIPAVGTLKSRAAAGGSGPAPH
ncbi:MAG: transporter, family, 4-hydroxybenzoate transporter [Bryobacterales bacterium]|nr:transporter, family, 4-hydroxybenzoate transporter [Bryobacterales bacterium]